MQLRRKKLALLISLIGAGVSPYAYARSDLRVVDPSESPLNIALDESATWEEAPAWHSADGTLELVSLPDDLHESMQLPPSSTRAADDRREAAHELPDEFSDAAPGEVTRETSASCPFRCRLASRRRRASYLRTSCQADSHSRALPAIAQNDAQPECAYPLRTPPHRHIPSG